MDSHPLNRQIMMNVQESDILSQDFDEDEELDGILSEQLQTKYHSTSNPIGADRIFQFGDIYWSWDLRRWIHILPATLCYPKAEAEKICDLKLDTGCGPTGSKQRDCHILADEPLVWRTGAIKGP